MSTEGRWVEEPVTEPQLMPSGRTMDEVANESFKYLKDNPGDLSEDQLETLLAGMADAYMHGLIDPVETDEGTKWQLTEYGRQEAAAKRFAPPIPGAGG